MKKIKLTQGKVALVDDEDYQYLNSFKWCVRKAKNTIYAKRGITVDGKEIMQTMHSAIMKGKGIDHRDHDGLNNQRSNLRFCNQSENNMNTRKRENVTSIYKGVSLGKGKNKWRSTIQINGKRTHLGYFTSETDAALAYNKKAIEIFCEFANLNVIP